MRILLVEDNPGDAELILDHLEGQVPATFHRCERLDDAIAQARSSEFDLALLDLNLPDSHGEDTYIRFLAEVQNCAVVVLTGVNDDQVGTRAVQRGAQDYLVKSAVNPELLKRTIRYAIERHTARRTADRALQLQTVGQVAGGIAHEFNNLAMVITSFTELSLQMTQPADPRHSYLKQAHSAALRAAELTSRLLVLTSHHVLQPREVLLTVLLKDMMPLIRAAAGSRVRVSMEGQSQRIVELDPVGFEQAMLNLALNARDAMPKGGELVFRCCDGNGTTPPWAEVEVRDNGCGMTAEVKRHVFEPFFTTKAPAGTGLGLTIVQNFVSRSGGAIRVVSDEGRGTTFTLAFPAVQRNSRASSREATVAGGSLVV